ncbi:hypothetical protein IWW45_005466, partial [Coemansia sp. RSA 485]
MDDISLDDNNGNKTKDNKDEDYEFVPEKKAGDVEDLMTMKIQLYRNRNRQPLIINRIVKP